MTTEPLFERDGDDWLPGELTRGPWDPNALHGSAVGALIAYLGETPQTPGPMHVVRASIDIPRAVPLDRLTPTVEVLRGGRRIQLVQVDLHHDDRLVATGRVLRMRTTDLALPDERLVHEDRPTMDSDPEALMTLAEAAEARGHAGDRPPLRGFWDAIDIRFYDSDWWTPGPASLWLRLTHDLAPGLPCPPAARAVVTADFSNGTSFSIGEGSWTFINADLTVHLNRPPTGDWVGLSVAARLESLGSGLSDGVLFDRDGAIGRCNQSLLLEAGR